ncbi:MAG: hypothetical protein GY940_15980 [bacterium]|nr:hypothetical protein [bacterium]
MTTAETIQYILEEGKRSGFSTVEAFGEKIKHQEYECYPDQEAVIHRTDTHRIVARAFWDTGDPVGFSLSKPGPESIKSAFSTVYSTPLPNRDENFRRQLPSSVKKMNLGIFDGAIDSLDVRDFDQLIDRIVEIMAGPDFQGLKITKIRLSKTLKKVYISNTNRLNAKYIKTLFNLQLSLVLGDNRIEVNQNRIFYRHLDPLRLISRGLNLLRSLTENQLAASPGREMFLILAPEASAFILKEFSHYFKMKTDRLMMNIHYPAILNIVDDPFMDSHAGSAPFDDEGVQVQPGEKFLVRKGDFSAVISDLSTAFQNNAASTGNGSRNHRSPFPSVRFSNLYIKPTVLPLKNLRSVAGNGVVVSLLKLKNIDNRGYLFSAYGYLFENHQMMEPVHFYFRTTFRSYFLNILKISKEIKFFHSAHTIGSPYILVKALSKADNILEV